LLDVLFPKRCAGCGSGPWPFCEGCLADLVPLSSPWCATCGCPADRPISRCHQCPPRPVSSARAPFLFRGPARAAVHRLKFTGWRDVAGALGAAMVAVNEFEADAVAWVPLSRTRLAGRGFDQSRALALEVGKRIGRPVRRLLARTGETPPQARRPGPERRLAMRGMFRAVDRAFPRVLLVDDVLTTGATAAACAAALRDAGARDVALLTAARAVFGRLPAHCYTRPGSRLGLWLPGDVPR
jgi:predicted amidophosphoribosyltransferase